jgi:L-aspartate oxidase
VQRDRERLEEAADSIAQWQRYVLARQFQDPRGWELQNMLTVAAAMTTAAHMREESRGVHLRIDFPNLDENEWKRHIAVRRQPDGSTRTSLVSA